MLTLDVDSRDLMARAKDCDSDAFAVLYARHHRYVLAIAQQWQPGHADDLAQDVWVRALGSLHLWQDRGCSPVAWLATITRNICHDRGRSWYVRHVEPAEAMPERIEHTDPADPVARRDMVAALVCIDVAQRQALVLHYLRDLSVAQVAVEMGRPVGSVKRLLFEGRRAMARELVVADA